MEDGTKERLKLLKEQQKVREKEKEKSFEKDRIFSELPLFDKLYRFADEEETRENSIFLDGLAALTPTTPDFGNLTVEHQAADVRELLQYGNHIWICALMGSDALLHLFSYGSMEQFVNDFDKWNYFSSHLLLIFDNREEFVFICEEGFIKSRIIPSADKRLRAAERRILKF